MGSAGMAGVGGSAAPGRCGDGVVDGALGETCDDGNADNNDACPDGLGGTCKPASCSDGFQWSSAGEADVDCGGPICGACPGALLLSEVVVTPTSGEYIELVNPSDEAVSLDHAYLADYPAYFNVAADAPPPHSSDFRLAFPPGMRIPPKSHVVVSLSSATEFHKIYGRYPDYDVSASDTHAPTMQGAFSGSSGLSDGDEVVVLFRSVPGAVKVSDLDYIIYGNTSDAVDKTSTTLLPTPYLPDTAMLLQHPAPAPKGAQQALVRCDASEGLEIKTGGNGYVGHDETSEAFDQTWRVLAGPTPMAATEACPVPKSRLER